jgi:uncharacterized membrane protein YtjA (UPF0391 family)
MLHVSIALLLLSLVAGIIGFSGLATGYAEAGRVSFAVFMGLFLVCAAVSSWRARSKPEQLRSRRRQHPIGGPGSPPTGIG